MSILSTNLVKKSLETEFSIAICRPTGDKWQSKTLFLVSFDPHSWIIKSVFRLSPTKCVHMPHTVISLGGFCQNSHMPDTVV